MESAILGVILDSSIMIEAERQRLDVARFLKHIATLMTQNSELKTLGLGCQSFPMTEKLDLVCHFFYRLGRCQFEQPPHLFADGVMLLFGENDPGM